MISNGALRATHSAEKGIPTCFLKNPLSLNTALLAKFTPDVIVPIGEAKHLRTWIWLEGFSKKRYHINDSTITIAITTRG